MGQTPSLLQDVKDPPALLMASWTGRMELEAIACGSRGPMGAGQWAVMSNQVVRPPYWARNTGDGEAGALGSDRTHLSLNII